MASVSFDKNRNRWKVYWIMTAGGIVKRGSKSFLHQHEAEAFKCEIEDNISYLKSKKLICSIHEAYQLWLLHINQFTDRTQEHYIRCIEEFLPFCYPKICVSEISLENILKYKDYLVSKGIENRTINSNLTPIMSFCKWYSMRFGIVNPVEKKILLKEKDSTIRLLTMHEYQLTLEHGSDLYRERAVFLANTGLRASEFCGLTFVRPQAPKFPCGWPEGDFLCVVGKGARRRYVPLNATCARILNECRDRYGGSGFIFMSKNGPVTRHALHLQFSALARRLEIPIFGPHSLRHLFATQLIVQGVSINKVSQILGHSSIRTTERVYAHWVPAHLAGVTDCLEIPA